jgi:hypothetical protein
MKKLITISVLLASFSFSSAFASMKYECWRHGGSQGMLDGYYNAYADSNAEAVSKAKEFWSGKSYDYIKCK